ncbi:MAG: hypothetical protein AAB855_00970, partial [Patescibacteria group bacterium]
ATQIQIATELGLNFIDHQKRSGVVDIGGELLGSTGIGTIGGIAGYVLGICMLMATLMAAQQLSSAGGGIAGAGVGYVKDWFAGKRGPFNPFRFARETIGGVKERYDKARKERVEKRVDSVYRAFGKAQQIPREVALAAGKAALATPVGRAARKAYEGEPVQRGLDMAARVATFGMGGWGQNYKARNEAWRRNQLAANEADNRKAGEHRGEAAQADRESMDYLTRSNQATNPTERAALRNAAEAARQRSVSSSQAAEHFENRIAGRKTLLTLDTAREKALGLYKEGAKLLLAGTLAPITGGLSVAAAYGAPYLNELGKTGEYHVGQAEGAQAGRVSEYSKKYAEMSPDEIHAEYARGTGEEKIAALMALGEKGELDQGELEQAQGEMIGLGAKDATMRLVQSKWGDQFPLRNYGLSEAEQISPETARRRI